MACHLQIIIDYLGRSRVQWQVAQLALNAQVHYAASLLDITDGECAQFGAIARALQLGGVRPRRVAKIG